MGNFSSKTSTDDDNIPIDINNMLNMYSYDLNAEVMLIFDEDEEHQQNQLIVFPHIQDTNLNTINDAYTKLQEEQKELDKNEKEAKNEVSNLTKRIQNTRQQIDGVFNEDLEKNKENITKFGDINNKLTKLKDNFSSLLSEYSITRSPLDISEPEPTQSIQSIEQKTEQKTEQKIGNIGNPVINIQTNFKSSNKKDNSDEISIKDMINLTKIGGGNIKFKDDPFDYIFEKFSKRELNKIGNDWNLPKTNKYNKDELINILKLMLKYKNNTKMTKKELKLLSTSIQVKRTSKE